jgi:hypothetical protein
MHWLPISELPFIKVIPALHGIVCDLALAVIHEPYFGKVDEHQVSTERHTWKQT